MTRWMGCTWLIALFFLSAAHAQAPAASPTGIAHIAVRVSDVKTEVDFLAKLGFQEAFSNVTNGQTTQAFIKVNDRQFIEVYPHSAAGEAPGPLGMMHVCYEAADLKSLFDAYTAEGLKPTSWRKAGAGNLLFNLADPDGRVTEFTQYLPGSRQMNDIGQHLGQHEVAQMILGFEMPVGDEKTAQAFYESMGFTKLKNEKNLAYGLAGNRDVRIVLSMGRKSDRPKLLLATEDAQAAADLIFANGLRYKRQGKKIVVRDPDGNAFVILESKMQRARSLPH